MEEYCGFRTKDGRQCLNIGIRRLFDERFPPAWRNAEAIMCSEHWHALCTLADIARHDPQLALHLLRPNIAWEERERQEYV